MSTDHAPPVTTSACLQADSTGQPAPAAAAVVGQGWDATVADLDGAPAELGMADLADDPRTDAEALCLCALLWSSGAAAARVVAVLEAADFWAPLYAELYALIAGQVGAGRPHDPASIATLIAAAGTGTDHHGTRLARALADVTVAGGAPETAGHYAIAVARAAYRRGYATAATSLTQAALELPEDQLFEHLVTIGRERRGAARRLDELRATLTR